MKEKKVFIKAFGLNEFGWVNFPNKMSNTKVSRLEFGDVMGCSWCFPHGFETVNATVLKNRKNWKFKRRKQYTKSHSFDSKYLRNNEMFNQLRSNTSW